jgi:hypothetical protein
MVKTWIIYGGLITYWHYIVSNSIIIGVWELCLFGVLSTLYFIFWDILYNMYLERKLKNIAAQYNMEVISVRSADNEKVE